MFLIRAKIVLKINWSVKTPLHEHMAIAHCGLWAPGGHDSNEAPNLAEVRVPRDQLNSRD